MEKTCDILTKVVQNNRPKTVGVETVHGIARRKRSAYRGKNISNGMLPLCLWMQGFLYFLEDIETLSAEIKKEVKQMAKVELKKPIVAEIAENIKYAQSVVIVDHRGLTVAEDTELRKQLREAGVTYKVYKNTMMNFAFKGTDCEGLAQYLEGPSAIAISKDDATAPARILCKFAKTAKALEIKGGVVEGTVYDSKGIEAISNVPSREELLGKLLGSIQSPITNLARVLNQIAEQQGA